LRRLNQTFLCFEVKVSIAGSSIGSHNGRYVTSIQDVPSRGCEPSLGLRSDAASRQMHIRGIIAPVFVIPNRLAHRTLCRIRHRRTPSMVLIEVTNSDFPT
jgi:hypothetical protein